jgi:hypothetical protein
LVTICFSEIATLSTIAKLTRGEEPQMADFDVGKLKTPVDCRRFMLNAVKHGRRDLETLAFRRLCELGAGENPDIIVIDFWLAIAALEEARRLHHGKTVRASRTRQKVKKDGVMATIESLATRRHPSEGFQMLVDAGLADLTAEYIVLRYPVRSSTNAIRNSRIRLEQYGVPLPDPAA